MPESESNYLLQLDLLGAKYSHKIQSCLSAEDFLEQIRVTVDMPSDILAPGEFPGGKTFKGYVRGKNFTVRKKGFAAGKQSRELQGRVSEIKQGKKTQTVVEVRFVEDPWVMLAKFGCMVILSACVALVLFSILFLVQGGALGGIPEGIFLGVIIPLVFCALTYYALRGGPHLAYRHEEEILDHVKKIAAGVVPNPDSVIG